MNPCPQGYDCDFRDNCKCTPQQQQRYRSKLSAPFLDRIDIQIEVPRLSRKELLSNEQGENSEQVRQRVLIARERQLSRQGKANRELSNREINQYCQLSKAHENLISTAIDRFKLSARAYHRILKVARSIADLAESDSIQTEHLTEALSYRSFERLMNTNQQNIAL